MSQDDLVLYRPETGDDRDVFRIPAAVASALGSADEGVVKAIERAARAELEARGEARHRAQVDEAMRRIDEADKARGEARHKAQLAEVERRIDEIDKAKAQASERAGRDGYHMKIPLSTVGVRYQLRPRPRFPRSARGPDPTWDPIAEQRHNEAVGHQLAREASERLTAWWTALSTEQQQAERERSEAAGEGLVRRSLLCGRRGT